MSTEKSTSAGIFCKACKVWFTSIRIYGNGTVSIVPRTRFCSRYCQNTTNKKLWDAANKNHVAAYRQNYWRTTYGAISNPHRRQRYADEPAYRAHAISRSQGYYYENREERIAATLRRRASKNTTGPNDFTHKDWQAMKAVYGHRCVYCGKKFKKLTMDHIIPLSKGGTHTASNIVPACRVCNCRKHARTLPMQIQPVLLLPLDIDKKSD